MPGCPPRAPLRLLPSQLCLRRSGPALQLQSGLVHMDGSMWKAFRFNLCRFRRVTAKEEKKKPLFQKRRLHKQKQQLPLLRGAMHLRDRSGHSLAAASPPAPSVRAPSAQHLPSAAGFHS